MWHGTGEGLASWTTRRSTSSVDASPCPVRGAARCRPCWAPSRRALRQESRRRQTGVVTATRTASAARGSGTAAAAAASTSVMTSTTAPAAGTTARNRCPTRPSPAVRGRMPGGTPDTAAPIPVLPPGPIATGTPSMAVRRSSGTIRTIAAAAAPRVKQAKSAASVPAWRSRCPTVISVAPSAARS